MGNSGDVEMNRPGGRRRIVLHPETQTSTLKGKFVTFLWIFRAYGLKKANFSSCTKRAHEPLPAGNNPSQNRSAEDVIDTFYFGLSRYSAGFICLSSLRNAAERCQIT